MRLHHSTYALEHCIGDHTVPVLGERLPSCADADLGTTVAQIVPLSCLMDEESLVVRKREQ